MKILVVDNDLLILQIVEEILKQEGHQVKTADSGLSAIDLFPNHHFDFIFIDYIMPQIDGKALCKVIRAIPDLKHARIVILSAIAAEEPIDLKKVGAHACIAKGPIDRMAVDIQTVLRELRDGANSADHGIIYGLERIAPRSITSELLSVKTHFELILDAMSEGILEINPSNRVVYSNPAAGAILDRHEKDILGARFHDLFPQALDMGLEERLRENQLHGGKVRLEKPIAVGEKFVVMAFVRLEGESVGQIAILNDVTDHIHIGAEKAHLEMQLRQSQKLEAIGTLAGGIAHDFNNLMMGIQGRISLVMHDISKSAAAYQHLKQMERYIESGSDLTRQLLGFARKGKYIVKARNINEIVEQSLEMFGRTKKGIRIHKVLDGRLWSVQADRSQIEQVLMNIFVNAVQAMPDTGQLTVTTANRLLTAAEADSCGVAPGKYVSIGVSDTGIGMDRQVRERIFDPFFTTKKRGRGTGLGLASAYGIIKNHGGNILVDSETGKGTTFTIYLPGSTKPASREAVSDYGLSQGSGTILVVDDEEMILSVNIELLKSLGYDTISAAGGQEAIARFIENRDRIDMVLLDMTMPGVGGGEVLDKIKAIDPQVRVMLTSGYNVNGEAAKVMLRGCDDFIQKPFGMEELSAKIRRILKKNRLNHLN